MTNAETVTVEKIALTLNGTEIARFKLDQIEGSKVVARSLANVPGNTVTLRKVRETYNVPRFDEDEADGELVDEEYEAAANAAYVPRPARRRR